MILFFDIGPLIFLSSPCKSPLQIWHMRVKIFHVDNVITHSMSHQYCHGSKIYLRSKHDTMTKVYRLFFVRGEKLCFFFLEINFFLERFSKINLRYVKLGSTEEPSCGCQGKIISSSYIQWLKCKKESTVYFVFLCI